MRSLVAPDGTLLARDRNRIEERHDPTAHAEMLVIRAAAARLGTPRLVGCDLYVTLEPCPMCAAAASLARLRRDLLRRRGPQGRRRRPWAADLRQCHLPSSAGGLWRHRRQPLGRAPARLLPGAALGDRPRRAQLRRARPRPAPAARPAPRRCAGRAWAGCGGRPGGVRLILSGLATSGTVPGRGAGVRQVEPHAARLHLRVGEHLVQGVDRPAGHAEAAPGPRPTPPWSWRA